MNAPNYPTIHYTQLRPAPTGDALEAEWNTYVAEVGRLLADGQEGKHVLIKGERIIGLYETHLDALDAGYRQCGRGPFLVHQVQTRERVFRVPCYYWSCPTSH
jgi:hypothetical protein